MIAKACHHHYHHDHHHHWQNIHFWAMIFFRRFCQFVSGFHVFGFLNSYFFTEQGRQPCLQPPTWRTRALYLYPPVTGWLSYAPRHRVPFSSLSTTRRATVAVFLPASTRGCASIPVHNYVVLFLSGTPSMTLLDSAEWRHFSQAQEKQRMW
jgi:hypothetical protein